MSWIVFARLSAVFAAAVAILGKIGLQGVDTTLATAVRAVVMAVILAIAAAGLGKFSLIGALQARPLLFIGLSGLAGALSWFFYFLALKLGPVSAVAALDRLSVVFVVILAALFLGEGLTWKSGLGAILITAGAILMTIK